MEQKKNLSEQEKRILADALGVDVSSLEYADKDRIMIKIFKDNTPAVNDNAELLFGGDSYNIYHPMDKVSELYERLNKKDQYIIYLETLLDYQKVDYKEKKKDIFDDK